MNIQKIKWSDGQFRYYIVFNGKEYVAKSISKLKKQIYNDCDKSVYHVHKGKNSYS